MLVAMELTLSLFKNAIHIAAPKIDQSWPALAVVAVLAIES
jgi:hypothetical protein